MRLLVPERRKHAHTRDARFGCHDADRKAAAPASAQDWPTRSVKIIVAFSPGGSADQFGRLIAEALSETFGQQFYIEYHPGSSGTIGAALTARAAPDGYTLMIGGSGPHITIPAINPNVGYDPIKDFSHIAMIAADGFVLIANPTLGIGNIAELVRPPARGRRRSPFPHPARDRSAK